MKHTYTLTLVLSVSSIRSDNHQKENLNHWFEIHGSIMVILFFALCSDEVKSLFWMIRRDWIDTFFACYPENWFVIPLDQQLVRALLSDNLHTWPMVNACENRIFLTRKQSIIKRWRDLDIVRSRFTVSLGEKTSWPKWSFCLLTRH